MIRNKKFQLTGVKSEFSFTCKIVNFNQEKYTLMLKEI